MTFPQFNNVLVSYSFNCTGLSVSYQGENIHHILHHIISLIISFVLTCGHVLCLMILQKVELDGSQQIILIKSNLIYFSHLNRPIYHRYFVSTVILSRSGPHFSWQCCSDYSTNTVVGCCRQEFVIMITISFSVTQVCVIVHFQSVLAPVLTTDNVLESRHL